MAQKKRWSELTTVQQAFLTATAAVELVLTAAALRDLATRPADDVRGPKAAWALACFVQPVGPVAYLTLGRRSG
jgi:hypothetical protein